MNIFGKFFWLILLCRVFLGESGAAESSKVLDLDTILDWKADFPTSEDSIETLLLPLSAFRSAKDMLGQTGETMEFRTWDRFSNDARVTLFQGSFAASRISLVINGGTLRNCNIEYEQVGTVNPVVTTLDEKLSQVLGMQPQESTLTITSGSIPRQVWRTENWQVSTYSMAGRLHISIVRLMAGGTSAARNTVDADLDYLLNFEELWNCTPDQFAQKYRPKTGEALEQPPQFEWLNSEKTRARFSRKMFSNVDASLTLFAKSMKVEEAVVEFVNGRAARVSLSFYNRGDTGAIALAEFDHLFKKAGQNLGQLMKVAPRNLSASVSSPVKTVSWQWQSPRGIALLEHNDYAADPAKGRPEFLRLKLASPDQADWSMGKLGVGVQRMALTKNITRTPEGDVYLAGVPMVDQGAKGYCVAASCQRLFEYMQIPCDQHEIAQLVNVDAESGANIFTMQKSLAKIDGQFKVAFKPHINPELYYSSAGKRRISQRQFSLIVKEHVDKGVPLLWALELGRFPEEPPLPGEGQISGGHMRMVIGYNTAKNQILFTDSWGAGHELKRMSEAAGYQATLGLYSMSPRGL